MPPCFHWPCLLWGRGPPAGAGRGATGDLLHLMAGQFHKESAGDGVCHLTAEFALHDVADIEFFFGTGDADKQKAAFFFEAIGVVAISLVR